MPDPTPLRFLLAMFAGWVNRQQAQAIDYLFEENRVLREQLGERRPRLTDYQRRRLAAKGKALGRRPLGQVATIVTPDTILRWHRRLIAAKHTYRHRSRVGRPDIMKAIRELILRMATDNSSWVCLPSQGELKKVGHRVARTTVAKTLKDAGVPPSPERPTSWRTFLRTHADVTGAIDFFTVDVWTRHGLVTHYVLFVIHHASRVVEIAGITTNPNGEFMARAARNLTDPAARLPARQAVSDPRQRREVRRAVPPHPRGLWPATRATALQAPDMNAFAERWVQSMQRDCLNRMILFGERHLRRCLAQYVEHYHRERPHQGLGNELITPRADEQASTADVVADERLAGCCAATATRPDGQARHDRPVHPPRPAPPVCDLGRTSAPNICRDSPRTP